MEHGPSLSYVVQLREKPVYVFSMGNPIADYGLILLIHCSADSVLANSDLVSSWVPLHLFKVPKIKRVLAEEIFEDDLLCMCLDVFRQFGKLFQKTLFVFNVPHRLSWFGRDSWPRAQSAAHRRPRHQ